MMCAHPQPNLSVNRTPTSVAGGFPPLRSGAGYFQRWAFMRSAIITLLLFSAFGTCSAWAEQKIPNGWRVPTSAELESIDYKWRAADPQKFELVLADFDGDGIKDEARLLVNTSGKKYALFVFMGSGQTIKLDTEDVNLLQGMGITELKIGTYKTACAKGYWKCEKGEPELLQISKPGISYFRSESAESVFYWLPSAKNFHRVWLSD